ncbi:MAG: transcription antitermination factor NusB [bacterium]
MNSEDKLIIKSMRDIRSLAFHFLYVAEAFDYDITIDNIIEMFRDGFNIEFEDDCFAVIMAFNAMDQREDLDKKIEPLLKNWKLSRLGTSTRIILRMSIWELFQEKTPPSIIINEAIELAKCFGEQDSYRFINGILDEICKRFNLCVEDEQNSENHQNDGEQSEQD